MPLTSPRIRTILSWLARLILAAIFLYSGLVKAGASEQFAVTIAQFTFLPPPAIAILAAALPIAEILAAILLLIPATVRLGALLTTGLLLTFIGAIAWALSQGLVVDCGCFGAGTPSLTAMVLTLARDVALLAMTALLVLPKSACPPTQTPPPLDSSREYHSSESPPPPSPNTPNTAQKTPKNGAPQ